MPELPEVETIRNDLKRKVLNKKIKKVDLRSRKIVKSSVKDFILVLEKNSFKDIERKGKLLVFALAKKNKYLTIHLRMTGQLVYQKGKKIIAGGHSDDNNIINLPNKHTHIIFHFSDRSQLFFNDLRRFGVIKIVDKKELQNIFDNFGVEPLEKNFSLKIFQNIIKNKKGNIKAFLLNQKYIAGIGNIYADEILFEAKILPNRKIDSLENLENNEIKKLFGAIKKILKKAVLYRGTTFNDYVDANGKKGNFLRLLKVYGKEEEKCQRCKKGIIQKVKIAGRGTRYCNKCQK